MRKREVLFARALSGVKSILRRLTALTKGSFRVESVSAHIDGDELVVTHGRIRLDMQDQHIDTDAVAGTSRQCRRLRRDADRPRVSRNRGEAIRFQLRFEFNFEFKGER
jgi:hypothetical protein